MSFSIGSCDISKYFYMISVSDLSKENLPIIKQRLENLNNDAVNDKIDDIIWSLEYHLESGPDDPAFENIEYFLFDYYKIQLVAIRHATVVNGLHRRCRLNLLHENTVNTCGLS